MPTRCFIAYDFALISGTPFKDVLDHAKETQPPELDIHFPGDDGTPKQQGTIWSSLVQKEIDLCEKFIAFVDLPNANVGFEIGYACGRKKQVGVYQYKGKAHAWLNEPPLKGQFKHSATQAKHIHDAFVKDQLTTIVDGHTPGEEVMVLCPSDGQAYLGQVDNAWGWRQPPLESWNLDGTLSKQFMNVGMVIWIIAPHSGGDAERDGTGNACLSILAGFAEALDGVDVRVFKSKQARVVADLHHRTKEFSSIGELKKQLSDLQIEWKATLDARKQPKPTMVSIAAPQVVATHSSKPQHIPPPPEDVFKRDGTQFIGRQAELKMGAESVAGMIARHRPGSGSPESGYRLIWTYGFGGMGKSWFLHRIRCMAEEQDPQVRSLVIDWDKPAWRAPLQGEPRTESDVLDAIATRLCQQFGNDIADGYWAAKDRVLACSMEHRKERDRFEHQLQLAIGQDTSVLHSQCEQLLRAEGYWDDDLAKRKERIAILHKEGVQYRALFRNWCDRNGHGEPCVTDPTTVRVEALTQAIRKVLQAHPLILFVDTCEVLTHELDARLRELLAPLLREPLPLLVLVGSRLRPDLHQRLGSRHGWRLEVEPKHMNALAFAEGQRFTVADIGSALERLKRGIGVPAPELAEVLHRITLGIPLAVRALLDMHEDGDPVFVDLSVQGDDERPLGEREQVRKVIGMVAERFLLNLIDHPERTDDLQDIIALALIPAYDRDVLAAYWSVPPEQRIRELTNRYSLLADGDLHPMVRSYLRRHWRTHSVPSEFNAVLARMQEVVVAETIESASHEERILQLSRHLDLRSWAVGDAIADEVARALCLALVYEADNLTLETIMAELPLVAKDHVLARKLWHRDREERPEEKEVVPWLAACCARSQKWNEEERAGLALLRGVQAAERNMDSNRVQAAYADLEKAVAHFGLEDLPRPAEVGGAYFDCGASLDPNNGAGRTYSDQQFVVQAAHCYERAIHLSAFVSTALNNVANLYMEYLNKPKEAEREYLAAIALDPKFAHPHNGLGTLYMEYLNKPEEVAREYLAAIALDPKFAIPHNGLGGFYMDYLNKPKEAEREFLAAIALDPKYAGPHSGLAKLYQSELDKPIEAEQEFLAAISLDPKDTFPHNGLGYLYLHILDRPLEAEAEFRKAIQLNPQDGSSYRGLAWYKMLVNSNVTKAAECAAEAVKVDPQHAGTTLVQLAIEAWDGQWEGAASAFTEWVAADPKRWLTWGSRHRLVALLLRAQGAGYLERFAEQIRSATQSHWHPWVAALDVLQELKPEAELSDPEAKELVRLLRKGGGR